MGGIMNETQVVARDKFGKEIGEGDIVEFAVYGPGPGKPYQQPEGILRCFVVFVDKAGEVYLDPRCDRDYERVILKASPDHSMEEIEETNWVLICGDESDLRLLGKAIKY
jgi:hypothetical protein